MRPVLRARLRIPRESALLSMPRRSQRYATPIRYPQAISTTVHRLFTLLSSLL